MVIWKQLRQIHFLIPEQLLVEVESAAAEKYMSRSEYIRYALDKEVGGKYPEAIKKAEEEDFTRFANTNDI